MDREAPKSILICFHFHLHENKYNSAVHFLFRMLTQLTFINEDDSLMIVAASSCVCACACVCVRVRARMSMYVCLTATLRKKLGAQNGEGTYILSIVSIKSYLEKFTRLGHPFLFSHVHILTYSNIVSRRSSSY